MQPAGRCEGRPSALRSVWSLEYGLVRCLERILANEPETGNDVGHINVAYRTGLSSKISDLRWSGSTNTLSTVSSISTIFVGSVVDIEAAQMRYNIEANGRPIPAGYAFQVVLQALVVSADAGYIPKRIPLVEASRSWFRFHCRFRH